LTERRSTQPGQQSTTEHKKPTNRLQTLIDNGTINQSQADAIMNALRNQMGSAPQGKGNLPGVKTSTAKS
jgi:hypothetical protein